MLRNPHHVFLGRGAELVGDATEVNEGRFEWVPLSKIPNLIRQGRIKEFGHLRWPAALPCAWRRELTGQQFGEMRALTCRTCPPGHIGRSLCVPLRALDVAAASQSVGEVYPKACLRAFRREDLATFQCGSHTSNGKTKVT